MDGTKSKCWLIRDRHGKPVRLNATPHFELSDLADDETVEIRPLGEAVALILGHEVAR